ncbi:hypothetical protein FSP39_013090 [Pinctada imbricata]|uniref:UBC core domain-containing protein n=1 Tax=Pinctada imbricata TaxID=66713 RepID=A0AA88YID4_PINIB|nr:hypothetical protein FSP39_013090 [Pinctada imbricata]
MGSSRILFKDFYKFQKEIKSVSDGQAKILECEDDNFEVFMMEITPNDGYYKGGKFKFKVDVSQGNWPIDPPVVICMTDIYHPNIDTEFDYDSNDTSNICVNLLDLDWCKDCSFDDCLQAILFLFYEPNFDDPLSPLCVNDNEFEEFVKISLEGGDIEGRVYETNYGWAQNMAAKSKVHVHVDEVDTGPKSTVQNEDSTETKPENVDTMATANDMDGGPRNSIYSTVDAEDSTASKCDNFVTEESTLHKCDKGISESENTKSLTTIADTEFEYWKGSTVFPDNTTENQIDQLTERPDANVLEHEDSNSNAELNSTVEQQNSTDMSHNESREHGHFTMESNPIGHTSNLECSTFSPRADLFMTKRENDVLENLADLWKTSVDNLSLNVSMNDHHGILRYKNSTTRKYRVFTPRNMILLTVRFKALCNWIKELVTSRT